MASGDSDFSRCHVWKDTFRKPFWRTTEWANRRSLRSIFQFDIPCDLVLDMPLGISSFMALKGRNFPQKLYKQAVPWNLRRRMELYCCWFGDAGA